MLKKELQILQRKKKTQRNTTHQDRIFFIILQMIACIKDRISIVKPETVLRWQRMIIKRNWTFNTGNKKRGRKPIAKDIKGLILTIKNDNILWGVRKIQGELKKLGIIIDYKTIWNILKAFRRKGKVKKYLNWKKFLALQTNSIYAMDFFTVDTIFNKRYYVFFIISHKTREIIRFAVTENPTGEFVRQQIIEFEHQLNKVVYLIHDNASQFYIDYMSYGINELRISVKAANMNAIAERFVKNARVESLDYFIILNRKQVKDILSEYICYYNTMRPHQGIDQDIPKKYEPKTEGNITKMPILSGLHHHYFRRAA
jgi:transposase InsO family protein